MLVRRTRFAVGVAAALSPTRHGSLGTGIEGIRPEGPNQHARSTGDGARRQGVSNAPSAALDSRPCPLNPEAYPNA